MVLFYSERIDPHLGASTCATPTSSRGNRLKFSPPYEAFKVVVVPTGEAVLDAQAFSNVLWQLTVFTVGFGSV